ncbi:MAG: porin [Verrucomicrobiota bacterium]
MRLSNNARIFSRLSLAVIAASVILHGSDSKEGFDLFLDHMRIFESAGGEGIQSLSISGRYLGQVYFIDSDEGEADDYESRHSRLGLKARFSDAWSGSVKFNTARINSNDPEFFRSWDDVFVDFKPSAALSFRIGRQRPVMFHEYRLSLPKVQTAERSQLVNQIRGDKTWGVSVKSDRGDFGYKMGLFASSDEGTRNAWFDSDGGGFMTMGINHSRDLFGFKGRLYLDYAYTDQIGDNSPSKRHLASVNWSGTEGQNSLAWDFVMGSGYGEDVFGFVVIPSRRMGEQGEIVGRFQISSGRNGGLTIQRRYEQLASVGLSGDEYWGMYLGYNYILHGNNLKLINGLEYAEASGGNSAYAGITAISGIRLDF